MGSAFHPHKQAPIDLVSMGERLVLSYYNGEAPYLYRSTSIVHKPTFFWIKIKNDLEKVQFKFNVSQLNYAMVEDGRNPPISSLN